MSQFENVTVSKTGNVYFDGKCISYNIQLEDGSKKSVGVILPSQLTFNTGAPEIMEIQQGVCRVRLKDSEEWKEYKAGESFSIDGDSSFDIEMLEDCHYVCNFG